jgi:hypothetical protein
MANTNGNNNKENNKENKKEQQQQQQQHQQQIQANMAQTTDFPDIEFGITTNGLSVTCSPMFKTTKFLAWDIRGPFVHNEVVECSYVIDADGLTIFASRFKKPKMLKFDIPLTLRKNGNMRLTGKMLRCPEVEMLCDLTNKGTNTN